MCRLYYLYSAQIQGWHLSLIRLDRPLIVKPSAHVATTRVCSLGLILLDWGWWLGAPWLVLRLWSRGRLSLEGHVQTCQSLENHPSKTSPQGVGLVHFSLGNRRWCCWQGISNSHWFYLECSFCYRELPCHLLHSSQSLWGAQHRRQLVFLPEHVLGQQVKCH